MPAHAKKPSIWQTAHHCRWCRHFFQETEGSAKELQVFPGCTVVSFLKELCDILPDLLTGFLAKRWKRRLVQLYVCLFNCLGLSQEVKKLWFLLWVTISWPGSVTSCCHSEDARQPLKDSKLRFTLAFYSYSVDIDVYMYLIKYRYCMSGNSYSSLMETWWVIFKAWCSTYPLWMWRTPK